MDYRVWMNEKKEMLYLYDVEYFDQQKIIGTNKLTHQKENILLSKDDILMKKTNLKEYLPNNQEEKSIYEVIL